MRNKPYIETWSGVKFPLTEDVATTASAVRLCDIIYALSRVCRFQGHCSHFYSVAQHSVLVWEICKAECFADVDLRWALLHDAHEAYLADLSLPVKWSLPDEFVRMWKSREDGIQAAIYQALQITPPADAIYESTIKRADEMALYLEAYTCMHSGGTGWMRFDNLAPKILALLRNDRVIDALKPMDETEARVLFDKICRAADIREVRE